MKVELTDSELTELIRAPLWAVFITGFVWLGYVLITTEAATSHAEKMAQFAVAQAKTIEASVPQRKVSKR